MSIGSLTESEITAQVVSKKPALSRQQLKTQIRKQRWLEVYKSAQSNVGDTSEISGIPIKTYYNWLSNDLNFRESLDQADQYLNDLAIKGLKNNLEKGIMPAIRFQLEARDLRYKQTKVSIYDQRQVTINYPHW